ncbi:hypothetical protein ACIA8H_02860 [Streptomyces goshikiensis]|uniref:hypothetical protein n=1 Tax=Streptomyces goshikiensis TaxID=1942 RepID=UPI00379085BE
MGFDEEWGRLRAEAAERAGRASGAPRATGATGDPAPAVAGVPDPVPAAREAARTRLADFRSRAVLVPLDERGGLWTAALGGLDWICAFSGEEALARFAVARDEADRAWPYRRLIGGRLLDEVLPALDFACGIALNPAGPDGTVFPPVRGIVPDTAAIDGAAAA